MDWIVEGGEDCGTEGIQGPQKTRRPPRQTPLGKQAESLPLLGGSLVVVVDLLRGLSQNAFASAA